jgi:uncharacterized protein GlcG (DUF336 family)
MTGDKWMALAATLAVALRDDRANLHTVEHPASIGPLHLDKITTSAGELAIRAGNEVIGAIGISGSPGGARDEACAQARIERIAKGLGAQ